MAAMQRQHIMWHNGGEESPDTKLAMDDFSLPGPYLIGGMHGSCVFSCSRLSMKISVRIDELYLFALLTMEGKVI